jgi:hypothetical protein
LDKKTLKFINLILVFLLAGAIAAFCSLLFSIFIETIVFTNLKESAYLFFNVFLEEATKLIFLYFLFDLFLKKTGKLSELIFLSMFFGFGFGLFEILFAVLKNPTIDLILPVIILLLIHIVTSILLSLAIWSFRKIKAINLVYSAFWLVLALLIHLFYNLFAINHN